MKTFSKKPVKVAHENSLAARCPELAAQLHLARNPPGTQASEIAWSSNALLSWKCPKGPDHEWQESPNQRTAKGRRQDGKAGQCPFCANMRVSITNSLATVRPDLAAQWHPTANGKLTPADVTYVTTHKAWWQGPNGEDHVWQAQVRWRTTQKGGVPFDTGHRLAKARSLAAVRPDLVPEWADLNGELTPDQVAAFSLRKVWWRRPGEGQTAWEATVADRARDRGCPYDHGHKVCTANCLKTLYPETAKEWSARNGDVSAADVTAHSTIPRWWRCSTCGKEWKATPKNRVNGSGCPVCHEKGLSRAEHRVAWELRYCFPGIPGGKTRIRCKRLAVPGRQRKREEREIDIPIPSLSVALEYDGWFWHRGKADDDGRKTAELAGAGWRVVRLREAGLPEIGPDDIRIGRDSGNTEPHVVAAAVVRWLVDHGYAVPNADKYLAAGNALMAQQAAADWVLKMAKVRARKKAARRQQDCLPLVARADRNEIEVRSL